MILFFLSCLKGQRDSLSNEKRDKKPKMDLRDRFYWGGNLGAWFGTVTFVDVSPLVGFRVNQRFSVGLGAIYNYYSYSYSGAKYSTSMYGGRVFGRYFILENVFAQAGWDRINRDNPYSFYMNERVWVDNILVGGGLRYPVGRNVFLTGTALWNLNQTPLSPYANPIIQLGVIGGF
jgi:hypothetical protein